MYYTIAGWLLSLWLIMWVVLGIMLARRRHPALGVLLAVIGVFGGVFFVHASPWLVDVICGASLAAFGACAVRTLVRRKRAVRGGVPEAAQDPDKRQA